jgi:hypothetical protein
MAGFDEVDKSSLTGVEETQSEQEAAEASSEMQRERDDAMNDAAVEMENARRNDEATQRHNDRVDYNRSLRDKARTAALDPEEIRDERDDIQPSVGSFDGAGISATKYDYSDVVGKPIRTASTPSGVMQKTTPRKESPELPSGAGLSGGFGFDAPSGEWRETQTSRARSAAKPMGLGLGKSLMPGNVFKIAPSEQNSSIFSMAPVKRQPAPINWKRRAGVDEKGVVSKGIMGNLFGSIGKPVNKRGVVAQSSDPFSIPSINIFAGAPLPHETKVSDILTPAQKGKSTRNKNKINATKAEVLDNLNPVDKSNIHQKNRKISEESAEKLKQQIVGRNSANERYASRLKDFGKYAAPSTTKASQREEYKAIAGVKIVTPPGTTGKGKNEVKVDPFARYAGSVKGVTGILNPTYTDNPISIAQGRHTTVKEKVVGNPVGGYVYPKQITQEQFDNHLGGERAAWEKDHPQAYQEQQAAQRRHDSYMKSHEPNLYHQYSGEPEPPKEEPYYDPLKQKQGTGRQSGSTEKVLRGTDVYESLTPYQRKIYGIEKGKVNLTQFAKIKSKVDSTRKADVKTAVYGMENIIASESSRKATEKKGRELESDLAFAFATSTSTKERAQEKITRRAAKEAQEEKQRSAMDSLNLLGKEFLKQKEEIKKEEKFVADWKTKRNLYKQKGAALDQAEVNKGLKHTRESTHRFTVKSDTEHMVEKLAEKKAEVKRKSLYEKHQSPMENFLGHGDKEPWNTKYNKEKEDALHASAGAPPMKVGKGLILASLEDSVVKGVKSEASRYKDDLLAGRKARAEENRRSFLYGGGLQPVNVTKSNPEGEFPRQSGKTARPRRKNPVSGTELSFFGKPFGAPKAPRRTRRGKIIKLAPAQRKRNSRKPKSFLDDVFGGRW